MPLLPIITIFTYHYVFETGQLRLADGSQWSCKAKGAQISSQTFSLYLLCLPPGVCIDSHSEGERACRRSRQRRLLAAQARDPDVARWTDGLAGPPGIAAPARSGPRGRGEGGEGGEPAGPGPTAGAPPEVMAAEAK